VISVEATLVTGASFLRQRVLRTSGIAPGRHGPRGGLTVLRRAHQASRPEATDGREQVRADDDASAAEDRRDGDEELREAQAGKGYGAGEGEREAALAAGEDARG
jgi:hypothetical protein